jgi:hypothetical protein
VLGWAMFQTLPSELVRLLWQRQAFDDTLQLPTNVRPKPAGFDLQAFLRGCNRALDVAFSGKLLCAIEANEAAEQIRVVFHQLHMDCSFETVGCFGFGWRSTKSSE